MNNTVFEDLCTCIRQAWSRKEGVIAKMKTSSDGRKTLTMCVGSFHNNELTAQKCMLWAEDDLLYEGPFMTPKFRHILTENHICYIEITNARLMERGKKGVFKCLKQGNCTSTTCTLKKGQTFQATPEVTTTIV